MAIPVGSKAPDFTLKSKTPADVEVKLSNNFGKKNTVLLFFPLAFTSVCSKEMCDVSSGITAYANLGAEVIAVSVDSPFAQAAWAASGARSRPGLCARVRGAALPGREPPCTCPVRMGSSPSRLQRPRFP